MLFAGFYIRIDLIRPWLRWIAAVNFLRYTFEMIYVNEFEVRKGEGDVLVNLII